LGSWILFDYQNFKKFFEAKRKVIFNSTLAFALVIFPIALFVLVFPEKYFGRAGEVSVFAQTEGSIELIKLVLIKKIFNFKGSLI
jgi:hypothetical protein